MLVASRGNSVNLNQIAQPTEEEERHYLLKIQLTTTQRLSPLLLLKIQPFQLIIPPTTAYSFPASTDPPSTHGRINTQELDRIFALSPKGIALGDFNAKHPAWSTGRANTNGTILHNHIADNNLVLLAPLEPTHFPHNHPSSSTLEFGILKNISAGDATSHNDLSSNNNPVFEINTSTNLAAPAIKISITNWTSFGEIIHNSIPGNPKMNSTADIDDCINQFTCSISTALNLATKVRQVTGPFRQLPPFILEKIKLKTVLENFTNRAFFPYKRKA
ncbi:hypothetical protein AVEN_233526-1 [Araneus ventricosus]|uniref:Endonuclease/exonuclease/phosphatase domain-containing protein n=1 Tax=Araneus ventricosus TaxID=182803 RepID=A0A4Y2NC07_ARAVE|nr:hypothetical protein AVEN_233526-1 [Araneus ventricosus]